MTGFEDLKVFDTTLRDGEQMPQLAFSVEAKLQIAKKLDELGVQVIEAGFPVNSAEEREASRRIKDEVSAQVCGCARVVPIDIEACHEGGCDMVDLICSTSDIQLQNSQNMDRSQAVEIIKDCVRRVKDLGMSCMFTPMDSTRTELDFLVEVCQLAQAEGADLIGLTDTVGVGRPDTIEKMVQTVVQGVDIPVSIHCHNDFGLAVANTISGIMAGAGMFQVCLNGLGERAGNAALEETVMALKSLYNIDCGIDTKKLYAASRVLERLSGVGLQPNKAVVGQNAFAHESGIHAAGMSRNTATFEPGLMTPEMVGHTRRLVVGKHTGKHGIARVLADAGLELNDSELKEIMQRGARGGVKGQICYYYRLVRHGRNRDAESAAGSAHHRSGAAGGHHRRPHRAHRQRAGHGERRRAHRSPHRGGAGGRSLWRGQTHGGRPSQAGDCRIPCGRNHRRQQCHGQGYGDH